MSEEAAWEAAGHNVLADAPPAAWEAGPSKKPTPESTSPAPTRKIAVFLLLTFIRVGIDLPSLKGNTKDVRGITA